jgi:hypothetical protein
MVWGFQLPLSNGTPLYGRLRLWGTQIAQYKQVGSPGRRCHSALSLAAIGCRSLRICHVIDLASVLSLLPCFCRDGSVAPGHRSARRHVLISFSILHTC